MNSDYGKSTKPMSFNNHDFDFGLGSNRSRPLNAQKNPTPSYTSSSSFVSTQPKPNTTPSSQPRPLWTHQPAPTQPGLASGPTSMVGDIFGKSWGSSSAVTNSSAKSSVGIVNKNPNLFGDLVSSALGQNKGSSNAPLKNANPVSASGSNKGAYSMGNMADSLPKTGNLAKGVSNWGSSESFGSYTSGYNSRSNINVNNVKNVNLGGASMRSGGGGGMGANKDPFGSLVDFGSKPAGGMNSAGKGPNKSTSGGNAFEDFQNASKSSAPSFTENPFPEVKNNTTWSNFDSYSKLDDFAIPTSQNQPPVQSSGADAFDSLFNSSSATSGGATKGSEGLGGQQFSGADDWGMDSEFGGGNDTGGTTELDGLPPPPAGVSASAATNKGMDNYKQGQYADAIKWLSWAVILHEKCGDAAATMDVLSSRASCYKEVGEYKKAVADCTKVLAHDGENVAVLVQRALLYESMEKYKLGAEDLRTVMKHDPGNRVARSTIHRLIKMAE
ncbi:uncharacterized protein LOC130774512 [Actinidia eriantha]|uniref:uncharacterized protein LOC130774512 n=1 Tax=Actinidia eriantha TaxID=165200 RepID=UPI0025879BC1|nr:uncharacterized protein LOC130774512 [Actinidia eriantha]